MGRVIRTRGFGAVLSEEELTLVREAEATVDRARRRADALLAEARREAEAIRAAAADAGRAEAAAAVLKAGETAREVRVRSQQQLLSLAASLARRIVGEELTTRPERIADIAKPLLERLRRARTARLRVHPDDIAALDGHIDPDAELVADPSLTRGDCVLESEIGTVDGRISCQVSSLVDAIARKFRAQPAD